MHAMHACKPDAYATSTDIRVQYHPHTRTVQTMHEQLPADRRLSDETDRKGKTWGAAQPAHTWALRGPKP